MFELTVSTTIDKQHYISRLYKLLSPEIKNHSGIVIKQNNSGRSYFSFAVEDTHKDYYKSKILDFIVFMINDDYKYSFYSEALFGEKTNILFVPFLKAISIFDSDVDREIIKNQIDFSGEILVDSFYYFRLEALRHKWQKTAEIINSNKILNSKNAMLDVLKYLTQMSDNVVVKTDITISSKQIKLKQIGSLKCYKRNSTGHSNFLTEIISLNPSKINLKIDDGDSDDAVVMVLNELFTDKIYLLN